MGSVTPNDLALFTDLYELTMLQAYAAHGMRESAVFSLYVRKLPEHRNYLVACGLDDVLGYLEELSFSEAALEYLASQELSCSIIEELRGFRFTGDVRAVPEGTPIFADEPILEIRAPIAEAQLVETFVLNQVQLETMLASKASRVVHAARGCTVVDFGLRRMHGIDAGLKAARAFHIAGVTSTSNVLAGKCYGIPIAGTMAHSYVQAHPSELEAFRSFAEVFPSTVLLVDTYDSIDGVRNVIRLARELGSGFCVRGIRLDSGDLGALAKQARALLDAAGLERVGIFASGSLDEYAIERLLDDGAPITGFGVGTHMGVSADAPYLDIVYKLVEYAGTGRVKLSPGKLVRPGPKQVWRVEESGAAVHDVLAAADEELPGRPLLELVMKSGRRLDTARAPLDAARAHAAAELGKLPERIRALITADPAYRVLPSALLEERTRDDAARVLGRRS